MPKQQRCCLSLSNVIDNMYLSSFGRRENMMAVELVTEHLKSKLRQHPLVRQYPNFDCMESSSILRQLHTIIRDRDTPRADFVFYADRLIRLVVEAGLGCAPSTYTLYTLPVSLHVLDIGL